MSEDKYSGYEKAAILLLSLGEDVASEVMKNFEAKEIRVIGNYLSKTNKIDGESVKSVVKEFCDIARSPEGFIFGGDDYLRSVLTKALGNEKATKVMENLAIASEDKGLEALRWIDPRGIANLIRGEHPQTIALILAHLDPDHAGQVVTLLPDAIRGDVMLRMATIESVAPGVIKEIEEVLNKQLQMGGSVVNKRVGGPDVVASILNYMDRASESAILGNIEQNFPEMAEKIRQMMFVFEDLINVDDRGIQEILKEVSKDDLVLAIKGAGDDMKGKIFKNMSERASQSIKEDMESKGPVRVSEIEKSQQAILKIAKRLEEEGKIVIGGKGGEEVVA
ncbi:MAG: flagellar motor switch protein FliG [Nitrospirae bacterium RIFCSPLOW2_12_42_9]|nr:MAG: flagellar motor switch protein FliG [Nitrospirae bacterium RIFCSPHIGHO2_02_FULL_42_12]OGW63134.1 MAG: flagellar motor switch protein FliG [Nitrospirae bacterium RIFCSPLOW2_12_42_9]HBI22973.1 flagellar motor switch protein FliG [Nitrospiraceae bacterium]